MKQEERPISRIQSPSINNLHERARARGGRGVSLYTSHWRCRCRKVAKDISVHTMPSKQGGRLESVATFVGKADVQLPQL